MEYFLFNQFSIRDPYTQLAWEEAIGLSMRKFGIKFGIRIWRNLPTLVLGISEKENQTIENSYLKKFQIQFDSKLRGDLEAKPCNKKFPNFANAWIARRASGGGTVFQNSTSNLNFSLFIDIQDKPELYPVQSSYQFLLGIAISALAKQGIIAKTAGKSDLSIEMPDGTLRKISGNAQFRKKDIIVQHGTLILDESLFTEVERYQLHPPEEPDYRAKRTHRDFLTAIPSPIDDQQFAQDMLNLLMQKENPNFRKVESREKLNFLFLKESLRLRKDLMLKKYSQDDWLWKSSIS
ncbi:MAG: lipoate--protein ligase family protein [Leptospira sp.]|nr:lipoate--protein ligase family protein [Leptospira sp.]NCS95148.1 lipoate--protein ligase family protein [Leptospira sp.]